MQNQEAPGVLLKESLEAGDVVIIVPPFAYREFPSLGVHLVQASCKHQGIRARVFYANLIFSHVIGSMVYDTIIRVNQATFIGERLFAASAFGLPPMGRDMDKLFEKDWLPDHIWLNNRDYPCRNMPGIFDPVREWAASIDWARLENKTVKWIDTTARQVAGMGCRIVGCSTNSGGLVPVIALLDAIKKANPGIITVIGGPLCDGEMAEGILTLGPAVDYIFSGEGEITFPSFVNAVLGGNLPGEKIIYGAEVSNLDTVPLPDFGDFFRQRKKVDFKPAPAKTGLKVSYETSRGCRWGRCTFCGVNGERTFYRTRSPAKIIEDLKQLVSRHNGCTIEMADTVMPLPYFKTLFPRISREIPSVRIKYEVKGNLTLDQVIALKQTGITVIQAGIESLSPSLLKRMRKGVTPRQIIALLRYARSVGIRVGWNILFGFPGDKIGEYEEMLHIFPLIHHLQPADRMTSMRIFRFSKYQAAPGEFNISNLRPAGLYKDVYPANADLGKIAYYFTGEFKARSYEKPGIIAALRKEYLAWRREWETYDVLPLDSLLPALHLERTASGRFVLHDTRGLPGRPEKTVVDKDQAKILSVARRGESPEEFKWALDAGLGIFIAPWFIPLAAAEPALLQEFECDYKHGS
jgi:ribosomal peptide maturation radical SAM protein 1